MKQMIKRIFSMGCAFLLAAILTIGSAVSVLAAEEMDETIKEQLIMMAEGLTETIIPLSDEEIESYQESADEFTASAMESWSSSKKELGEAKEDKVKDTEVEMSDDNYVATVFMAFEKAEANFVYTFDETGSPVSMSVDVQYPLSVNLQRAGLNTLMGLATVFIMLVFLSFVISLFKYIPKLVSGKKKEEAKPAAPAAVPAAVPVQVQEAADDNELIAVIAAAIAASEGTSTDGFVVRSIRKINRRK